MLANDHLNASAADNLDLGSGTVVPVDLEKAGCQWLHFFKHGFGKTAAAAIQPCPHPIPRHIATSFVASFRPSLLMPLIIPGIM